MTTSGDRVTSFLLRTGAHQERRPEGVGWLDSDSGLVVVDRGATLDVVGWGKGVTGPPVLSGASADEAAAYLVLHFGDGWRLDQGWSRLVIAQPSAPLPPGFELTEADDGDAVLERRGAGALRLALPWQATRLAHALSVPLDDLVASYEHPLGLPSFPQ